MKVWIVTTGEPIPEIDGNLTRQWRSDLIAKSLINRGHEVVRWAGTFDHTKKKNRFNFNRRIKLSQNYIIQFFYSRGYKRNIGFQRFFDHFQGAVNFRKLIQNEDEPNIIICSLPTLELCKECVIYSRKKNIPVILDIRDLWPDVFLDVTPNFLQPFLRIILYRFFSSVSFSCKYASGLTGISFEYINWGLKYAERIKTSRDSFFPHGYMKIILSQEDRIVGKAFWDSFDFLKRDDFIICLFSSLGNVIDFKPIVEASNFAEKHGLPIKFVICGDGNKADKFKNLASSSRNILFPGWVNKSQIQYLMEISSLGIMPYKDVLNYQLNIPNKPIEYLSSGLPVLTSVSGLLSETLSKFECGRYYSNNVADDLSKTIMEFYNNPTLLAKYSENARELFELRFNAINVYNEMSVYIENILGNEE